MNNVRAGRRGKGPALALALATLFSALLGHAAALAQAGSIPEARVTWYGVYRANDDRLVKDDSALLGERTVSTGIEPPTANSERIPAVLHSRFGFGFTLSGVLVGRLVRLRWVRNFPPPGLLDTKTGDRHMREESEIVVRAGDANLFVGYLFDADEELAPGPWSFELWQGDRELLERSFTVYRP
jgi:hypothetical protein